MQALRSFPRWIPSLAAAVLLLLLLYLGFWQAGKADRLEAQRAQHAARALLAPLALGSEIMDPVATQDRPAQVRGRYEPAQQFMVDNRQENGRPGVHVVVPLKIEGSEMRILVNRGWVGWTDGRRSLPQVATPEGVVQVQGVLAVPVVKNFLLMPERPEAWSQLWSRLDVKRFAQTVSYPVQPVVLLQTDDLNDGLVRHWPAPEDRVAKHRSYSFQWFAMAAALVVFYFVTRLRKAKQEEAQP